MYKTSWKIETEYLFQIVTSNKFRKRISKYIDNNYATRYVQQPIRARSTRSQSTLFNNAGRRGESAEGATAVRDLPRRRAQTREAARYKYNTSERAEPTERSEVSAE